MFIQDLLDRISSPREIGYGHNIELLSELAPDLPLIGSFIYNYSMQNFFAMRRKSLLTSDPGYIAYMYAMFKIKLTGNFSHLYNFTNLYPDFNDYKFVFNECDSSNSRIINKINEMHDSIEAAFSDDWLPLSMLFQNSNIDDLRHTVQNSLYWSGFSEDKFSAQANLLLSASLPDGSGFVDNFNEAVFDFLNVINEINEMVETDDGILQVGQHLANNEFWFNLCAANLYHGESVGN